MNAAVEVGQSLQDFPLHPRIKASGGDGGRVIRSHITALVNKEDALHINTDTTADVRQKYYSCTRHRNEGFFCQREA